MYGVGSVECVENTNFELVIRYTYVRNRLSAVTPKNKNIASIIHICIYTASAFQKTSLRATCFEIVVPYVCGIRVLLFFLVISTSPPEILRILKTFCDSEESPTDS